MSIGHQPLGRRLGEDPAGRNVKRRKKKNLLLLITGRSIYLEL